MNYIQRMRDAEVLTLREAKQELLVYLKWALQFCPPGDDYDAAVALIGKHRLIPITPKPIRLVANDNKGARQ